MKNTIKFKFFNNSDLVHIIDSNGQQITMEIEDSEELLLRLIQNTAKSNVIDCSSKKWWQKGHRKN